MSATTRRGAIGRALVAVGGLVGIGTAGVGAAGTRGTETLVLYARDVVSDAPDGSMVAAPMRGDRLTLHGRLAHRPGGRPVGELHGASLALRGPGSDGSNAERLELHTFKLDAGTIIGSGTSAALEGEFAILGGTGRYAGARGTYTARHHRRELGGDGSAEFRFTLTA